MPPRSRSLRTTGDRVRSADAAGGSAFAAASQLPHTLPKRSTFLDGEYIIFIDGSETRCPAGSFVYIPRGVVHGFRVGDRPSKKLNLYVPAAMVGYFDELADAVATGNANDELLGTIAERYGMEVLGPVPEGYV